MVRFFPPPRAELLARVKSLPREARSISSPRAFYGENGASKHRRLDRSVSRVGLLPLRAVYSAQSASLFFRTPLTLFFLSLLEKYDDDGYNRGLKTRRCRRETWNGSSNCPTEKKKTRKICKQEEEETARCTTLPITITAWDRSRRTGTRTDG
jgi:hypothetical protein